MLIKKLNRVFKGLNFSEGLQITLQNNSPLPLLIPKTAPYHQTLQQKSLNKLNYIDNTKI